MRLRSLGIDLMMTLTSSGWRFSASCHCASGTRRLTRRASQAAVGLGQRGGRRLVVAPVGVDRPTTATFSSTMLRLSAPSSTVMVWPPDETPVRQTTPPMPTCVMASRTREATPVHSMITSGPGNGIGHGARVVGRAQVAHQVGLDARASSGR